MRGDQQAAHVRLLSVVPGRRWSTWIEQVTERRSVARQERLETIVRLQADERRARRRGEYAPNLRRLL
jgi:hypothetical protein